MDQTYPVLYLHGPYSFLPNLAALREMTFLQSQRLICDSILIQQVQLLKSVVWFWKLAGPSYAFTGELSLKCKYFIMDSCLSEANCWKIYIVGWKGTHGPIVWLCCWYFCIFLRIWTVTWNITLALLGECFPASWRKVLPSFLWVQCPKKMMQHQVQQDHNYQLHCCENLKPCTS